MSIFGFGDGAQAYFHKDLGQLDLPEAAFLAGVIRAPNLYSPYKNPERALARRNVVLRQMVETGAINAADARRAMASPLGITKLAPGDSNEEAYFEDMVTEQLRTRFSEREISFGRLKVYTTLDLDMERAAAAGAGVAEAELDAHFKKSKSGARTAAVVPGQPQLALVALDPQTGDVECAARRPRLRRQPVEPRHGPAPARIVVQALCLCGGHEHGAGRNPSRSSRRPRCSTTCPPILPVVTPTTVLISPATMEQSYRGVVTVREALAASLNIPTVSLAQMVGYSKVRKLALAAGFNAQLESTPSLALGAYVATPLEVAGAYTIFANQGQYVAPRLVSEVDDASGACVWSTWSPRAASSIHGSVT